MPTISRVPAPPRPPSPPALLVHGMSGMGDNIHERALVRRWIGKGYAIWLETPWPILFRDLDVHCVRRPETLRTQARNAEREADRFSTIPPPRDARRLRLSYAPSDVVRLGGVLPAMARSAGEPMGEDLDFRFGGLPSAWRAAALDLLAAGRDDADRRPIMVYRPLVERREWGGCRNRNPDFDAYRDLYASIRERFFVVSVADLEPKVEWTVGHPADVDLELHAGELSMEALIGLWSLADLAFASPGFAVLLAQATGTPAVCVFGGYETTSSFSAGARFSPTLALGPHPGCGCFTHHHRCAKAFDVADAARQLERFIECPSPTSRRLASPTSTGRESPAGT